MKKTFKSEDQRKDNLFEGWNAHLDEMHARFEHEEFEEIYEGLARVERIKKGRVFLELGDGRKVRNLELPLGILSHTTEEDAIYLVLGRKSAQWWPLNVISILSLVDNEGRVHLSFNPIYVNLPTPMTVH